MGDVTGGAGNPQEQAVVGGGLRVEDPEGEAEANGGEQAGWRDQAGGRSRGCVGRAAGAWTAARG